LFSCEPKKPGAIDLALEKKDTVLAKKLAQKELDSIRASITDSNFATTLDAMLLIQQLELTLQKTDTSRINKQLPEECILNHPDGQRLYYLMMQLYRRGLNQTKYRSDKAYFTNQLSLNAGNWLAIRFTGKKTYEALISLWWLQKDLALISLIENHIDNEPRRKDLEKSYGDITENLQRGY
jgi:hypothetical protein